MDDRWEKENHKWNHGVILLGVVTAAVLGSVLFSFGEKERVEIPTVSQLLEAGENGSDLPVSGEEKGSIGAGESEKDSGPAAGRVKGPLDVSDVVEAASPSIVAITSESIQVVESYFYGTYQIPSENAGSGIIIGENDEELLIATNYHVVEDADNITVCFSLEDAMEKENAMAEARVKGTDSARDLAVVAVNKAEITDQIEAAIRVALLGDSDSLKVGERAVAIGNALGYGQSVTQGIISALDRELTVDQMPQKFIQTDAAINFGNSGGALLNTQGQVIGINSAKAAADGVERMGYAIPINDAKPILENLMNRVTRDKVDEGEAGDLGAQLRNVSEEAQQLYGISAGAFVYELSSESALGDAGLVQGDIITAFDENRIGSAEELERLLNYYKAGETVTVRYETAAGGAYQEKTARVTLGEKTEARPETGYQIQPFDPFGYGGDSWFDSWWGF